MAQQSDRAQVEHLSSYIGLIIALIIASLIAASFMGDGDQIRDTTNHFNELCTSLYGDDALVYNEGAALSPDHSGRHCDGGPGEATFHLSQIPGDIWQQYKAGEMSAEYVHRHLEPTPGLISWYSVEHLILTGGIVLAAVILIAIVSRVRSTQPEEDE